jgi:hypothetical protein
MTTNLIINEMRSKEWHHTCENFILEGKVRFVADRHDFGYDMDDDADENEDGILKFGITLPKDGYVILSEKDYRKLAGMLEEELLLDVLIYDGETDHIFEEGADLIAAVPKFLNIPVSITLTYDIDAWEFVKKGILVRGV